MDILDVIDTSDEPRSRRAEARATAIIAALSHDKARLAQAAIAKELLADPADLEEAEDVTDVVFVVHGMRDYGFWTQKLARRIRERGGDRVRVVNPSYGYFPILPFTLPWVRRRKVDWLMDKYVEVRKRYPNAGVSYVGHSNGSYLLARALREYPSARFKHVLFAGSCVRADYPWSRLEPARTGSVLNVVATADWVIALLAKGLQAMRAFDLGSAGHDGFRDPQPTNLKYAAGTHSAGITEHHWNAIADFVLHGTKPEPSAAPELFRKRRHFAIVALGVLSTLLLLIGVGAVVAGAVALLSAAVLGAVPAWMSQSALGGWLVANPVAPAFLFVAYFAVVRFVLTRY
jgi:hypothetical protein